MKSMNSSLQDCAIKTECNNRRDDPATKLERNRYRQKALTGNAAIKNRFSPINQKTNKRK